MNEGEFEEKKTNFNLKKHIKIKRQNFILSRQEDIKELYSFKQKIGDGGFGKVYKCKHRDMNSYRAIKVVSKERIENPAQFRNEIQALKLLDHPNIIKLYEIFEDENKVYMSMDICEGGELL